MARHQEQQFNKCTNDSKTPGAATPSRKQSTHDRPERRENQTSKEPERGKSKRQSRAARRRKPILAAQSCTLLPKFAKFASSTGETNQSPKLPDGTSGFSIIPDGTSGFSIIPDGSNIL